MANRKSEPLTDEEIKARNRIYQHRSRHKTDNHYSRAYKRTERRAVRWFQGRYPDLWMEWLQEELAEAETKKFKSYPREDCVHDGKKHVIGLTIACDLCGSYLGSVAVSEADRDDLTATYDVTTAYDERKKK